MLIFHKGHNNNIQVYSVTVMTHVKALQAGQSSQGTFEPITPAISQTSTKNVKRQAINKSERPADTMNTGECNFCGKPAKKFCPPCAAKGRECKQCHRPIYNTQTKLIQATRVIERTITS